MNNIETLHLEVFDFFLMDVGSSGYTEYEMTKDLFIYMNEKGYDLGVDVFMGHTHSHHSMPVYFSGTDEDELCINAPQHNAYLSVIVNCKDEVCAKIAHVIDAESVSHRKFKYKNFDGSEINIDKDVTSEDKGVVVSYDAIIEKQEPEVNFALTIINNDESRTNVTEIDASLKKQIDDYIRGNILNQVDTDEWEKRRLVVMAEKAAKRPTPQIGFNRIHYPNMSGYPGEQGSSVGKQVEMFQKEPGNTPKSKRNESENSGRNLIAVPVTERDYNNDGTVEFTREEVETFLKKCMKVSDKSGVTLYEFIDKVESMESDHAIQNIVYEGIVNRALGSYHEMFPEDHSFDYYDQFLEECISIVDNYYSEQHIATFRAMNMALDECLTLFSDRDDEQDVTTSESLEDKEETAVAYYVSSLIN